MTKRKKFKVDEKFSQERVRVNVVEHGVAYLCCHAGSVKQAQPIMTINVLQNQFEEAPRFSF